MWYIVIPPHNSFSSTLETERDFWRAFSTYTSSLGTSLWANTAPTELLVDCKLTRLKKRKIYFVTSSGITSSGFPIRMNKSLPSFRREVRRFSRLSMRNFARWGPHLGNWKKYVLLNCLGSKQKTGRICPLNCFREVISGSWSWRRRSFLTVTNIEHKPEPEDCKRVYFRHIGLYEMELIVPSDITNCTLSSRENGRLFPDYKEFF